MANFWEADAIASDTAENADFWKNDVIHNEDSPAISKIKKYGTEALGIGEAVLSQATGTGAAVYGGLKGLLRGGVKLATGSSLDQAAEAATNDINAAAADYTYEPRTKTGETINKVLALPVEGLKYVGGGAGAAIGGALGNEEAGRAIGETVAQAVPVLYGGKAALKSPTTAALNRRLSEAMNRPRQSRFGGSERGSVGIPPEPTPSQPIDVTTPPDYVAPPSASSSLPSDTVLKKRGWSDAEIERMRRYERQGITPMLGDITREPSDVRFQDQSAARGAGSGGRHYDIYEAKLKQNDQVYQAFDNLKETIYSKDGEPLPDLTPEDASAAIRKDIETARKADQEIVRQKYEAAQNSPEALDLIDVHPLNDLMYEMRNYISVPEVNGINTMWEKLKKKNEYEDFSLLDAKGKPINPPSIEISLGDLENLRKKASDLRKASPSANYHLKNVINQIDALMEGKGGDLFKEARKASSDYRKKYKNLKGMKDVTDADMFTGEFRVPEEQLFNKLVVGKAKGFEGFKNVYDNLTPETRSIIKNQMIEYIRNEGYKGQESLQSGKAPFSPANIRRAIQRVGDQKLEYVLGKQGLKELKDLSKSATELKAPSYRVNGSDTAVNIFSKLGHLAVKGLKASKNVPLAGHAVSIAEGLFNTAIEDSKIRKHLNPLDSKRSTNRIGGGAIAQTGRKLSQTVVPAAVATKPINPVAEEQKGE